MEEEEEDDVHCAFNQLYALFPPNLNNNKNLDEMAKLVLKRLLDGVSQQAFLSHSKVSTDKSTSSLGHMTLQQRQISNSIPRTSPSNIPSSIKEASCSSVICYSSKRCPVHEKSSTDRLNPLMISSHDESFYQNDIAFEHINKLALNEKPKEIENFQKSMHRAIRTIQCIRSVMGALSDVTSSKDNHLEHIDECRLDKASGLSNYNFSHDFEDNAVFDHQIFSPAVVGLVKENNCDGEHHGSSRVDPMSHIKDGGFQYNGSSEKLVGLIQASNSVSEGNYLLPKQFRERAQMPSPKDENTKEGQVQPGRLSSQKSSRYIERQNSVRSRAAKLTNLKSKELTILADQNILNSRIELLSQKTSQKTERTRESSLQSQMLDGSKAMNQRQNIKTMLMGPTLLRKISVGPHTKKGQPDQVHKRHDLELCGSNQKPSQGIHSQQITNSPKLLEEKRKHGKHTKPKHVSIPQQRRSGTRRRNPSKQTANMRTTSISTSASYSSWASRGTIPSQSQSQSQSQSSVPSMTTTHQRVNPTPHLARERSMKQAKKTSQIDFMAGHQAGSTVHSNKRIGRLKRFKNKLGVIFHHHHHHHHHHHDGASQAKSPPHAALSHNSHSFWRYLQKVLHGTRADDQGKNSRLRAGAHKHQGRHGGLLDGLIRHVWHSKKSKQRSGDSHKKKVKKWHWWQKVYYKRGRAAVRQTSIRKAHVRTGFKAKRPKLRALKPN